MTDPYVAHPSSSPVKSIPSAPPSNPRSENQVQHHDLVEQRPERGLGLLHLAVPLQRVHRGPGGRGHPLQELPDLHALLDLGEGEPHGGAGGDRGRDTLAMLMSTFSLLIEV